MAKMDILQDYIKENQRKSVRKHSGVEVRDCYKPKLPGTVLYRLCVPGRKHID